MKFLIASVLVITFTIGSSGVSVEQDLSLTFEQKQALDKFRKEVSPILEEENMKTAIYQIRWLRAQNFDVLKATTMLKENLRWRNATNMKNISLENFDDMYQEYPATLTSHDKEGRPVAQIDIFNWNIRDCVLSGRGPRLLRYLDMIMDNLTMQVFEQQKKGLNVTQWTALANADGFNMVTHGCPVCLPVWVSFLYSLDNHFQGWLDHFIVIEAPPAVGTIFNFLSPLMSKQTRGAIKIYGMTKHHWMPYLDSMVSREERRPPYGGTKSSVDDRQ